ncbi:MAG: hypothetical protein Q8O09_01095 [Bacillota bacterium]|nr:hypothetical protein [Bacillota bacterium]
MMPIVFVANTGEDTVSVICPKDMREIHKYHLNSGISPVGPRRIAEEGGTLYIAASFANALLKMSTSGNGGAEAVSIGKYPTGVCLHGKYAYVSCGESDSVWRVRKDNLAPAGCFPGGAFPNSIEICGKRGLLTADVVSAEVILLHPEKGEALLHIKTGGPAYFAACHPVDGTIFCSRQCGFDNEQGCVSVYTGNGRHLTTLRAGVMPGPIRFFEGGKKAAVSDTGGKGVFILNCENMEIEAHTEFDGMIDDIIVIHEEGMILAANMEEGVVEAVDFSGKKAGRAAVGREPRGLALKQAQLLI